MSSISVAGSKSKTFTIVDLMDWALPPVNCFSHYIHARFTVKCLELILLFEGKGLASRLVYCRL